MIPITRSVKVTYIDKVLEGLNGALCRMEGREEYLMLPVIRGNVQASVDVIRRAFLLLKESTAKEEEVEMGVEVVETSRENGISTGYLRSTRPKEEEGLESLESLLINCKYWSSGHCCHPIADIERCAGKLACVSYEPISPAQSPKTKKEVVDDVNHPPHYTSHPSGVECIQITEHMNFNLGNALKYIWRADLKGGEAKGIQDLEKAAFYIKRELSLRSKDAADKETPT